MQSKVFADATDWSFVALHVNTLYWVQVFPCWSALVVAAKHLPSSSAGSLHTSNSCLHLTLQYSTGKRVDRQGWIIQTWDRRLQRQRRPPILTLPSPTVFLESLFYCGRLKKKLSVCSSRYFKLGGGCVATFLVDFALNLVIGHRSAFYQPDSGSWMLLEFIPVVSQGWTVDKSSVLERQPSIDHHWWLSFHWPIMLGLPITVRLTVCDCNHRQQ